MSYLCGAFRWLPIILCVATLLSIFLTYGIAVGNDHVSSLWPYISDTGTIPPESCIFGLLLSAISFFICFVIYIKYREVSEYVKLYPSVGIKPFWNKAAAFLGYISALGLHMVASFQEFNEFTVHIVGAMMCFFSATIYFVIQTVFTRKMQPEAKIKFWMRLIFTVLDVLFIVGTLAPLAPSIREFKGSEVLKWSAKDGGFTYHLISTFSEWFLIITFCCFVGTFFWDFKKLRIEPPRIQFLALEKGTCQEGSEVETVEDAEDKKKAGTLWI